MKRIGRIIRSGEGDRCNSLRPHLLFPWCQRSCIRTPVMIYLLSFSYAAVNPTFEPTKPTMDPCFDQSCAYHGVCVVDQGLPKCVCPSNCANTSSPVCGSDGKTYENECVMRRASCTKQLTITVASRSRCRE